jgi:thymidine kinase
MMSVPAATGLLGYGRLHVIVGPMFSGKSTRLLERILCARDLDSRDILVLKPAMDERYGISRVATHDGKSTDGIAARPMAIRSWPTIRPSVSAVFIDEVQFFCGNRFDGDIVTCVQGLLTAGVDVTACGLDMDFRGEPFLTTSRLMAMADEVDKRTSACSICGNPASKTFKKSGSLSDVVELGASEKYEPRCNRHWIAYAVD